MLFEGKRGFSRGDEKSDFQRSEAPLTDVSSIDLTFQIGIVNGHTSLSIYIYIYISPQLSTN